MKKILFGVSGSIAAYRTYDVVKDLVRLGHEVRVVLTRGAEEFVKPELYSYLGASNIYLAKDDFQSSGGILHIELARWCDLWILCPASANTIAKLAQGSADDLLTSIFLSIKDRPCLIFPAMNSSMYEHKLTKKNLNILREVPQVNIIEPQSGLLACLEEGKGKLGPVSYLTSLIHCYSHKTKNSKKVLITTGATLSPLDPIRYLTNASTGTMGKLLAQEFLALGHEVHVIATQTSTPELDDLRDHPLFTLTRIVTADEMLVTVQKHFPICNLFIASAAVNDLSFHFQKQKIKKANIPSKLAVYANPDILAIMLKKKKDKQVIIGFGGEHPCTEKLLLEKWKRKKVDLLIGNEIQTPTKTKKSRGYGHSHNEYWWISGGKLLFKKMLNKEELAQQLCQWYQDHVQK